MAHTDFNAGYKAAKTLRRNNVIIRRQGGAGTWPGKTISLRGGYWVLRAIGVGSEQNTQVRGNASARKVKGWYIAAGLVCPSIDNYVGLYNEYRASMNQGGAQFEHTV